MIEHNSKIYLAGFQKPLSCSNKVAKMVNQVFLDPGIEPSKAIEVNGKSFAKSAIRGVEINQDTDTDAEKTHWVIFSKKKNCIWKASYKTLQEAQSELDFQEISLPEGFTRGDWVIQKR